MATRQLGLVFKSGHLRNKSLTPTEAHQPCALRAPAKRKDHLIVKTEKAPLKKLDSSSPPIEFARETRNGRGIPPLFTRPCPRKNQKTRRRTSQAQSASQISRRGGAPPKCGVYSRMIGPLEPVKLTLASIDFLSYGQARPYILVCKHSAYPISILPREQLIPRGAH
jgi:hypothetical protein